MKSREYDHRNYIVEHKKGLSVLWNANKRTKLQKKQNSISQPKEELVKINSTHISLYTALFSIWNDSRWRDVITPSVSVILERAVISETTYRKCLKDLRYMGLLTFSNGTSKNQAIRIRMQPHPSENEVTSNVKIRCLTPNNTTLGDIENGSYSKQEKPNLNNKKNRNDFFSDIESQTKIIE